MSAVESMRPRFGVRSDFFHGIALFHIGRPLMMSSVEERPTGAKTMTSYFERRSSSFADGLRADVVEGNAGAVERVAPPAFGLRGEPGVHEGDARRGDVVHRARRALRSVACRRARDRAARAATLSSAPLISSEPRRSACRRHRRASRRPGSSRLSACRRARAARPGRCW